MGIPGFLFPGRELCHSQLWKRYQKVFFKKIGNALSGTGKKAEILNADIWELFPKPAVGEVPELNHPPEEVSFFQGHDILSSKMKVKLSGLKALKKIGSAEATSKIEVAKKRLFSFKNVTSLYIDGIILLEEILNEKPPHTKAAGFRKKLKEGKLFLVTEVLQTPEFVVQDVSDVELSGNISVSAVKDVLAELKASAEHGKKQKDKISFKSESGNPVSFALKAFRINHDRGLNTYSFNRDGKPLESSRSAMEGFDSVSLGQSIIDIE